MKANLLLPAWQTTNFLELSNLQEVNFAVLDIKHSEIAAGKELALWDNGAIVTDLRAEDVRYQNWMAERGGPTVEEAKMLFFDSTQFDSVTSKQIGNFMLGIRAGMSEATGAQILARYRDESKDPADPTQLIVVHTCHDPFQMAAQLSDLGFESDHSITSTIDASQPGQLVERLQQAVALQTATVMENCDLVWETNEPVHAFLYQPKKTNENDE